MRDWLILALAVLLWLALTTFLGHWLFSRVPSILPFAVSPRLTACIIVAIPIGLGLLDVGLYWLGGNDSTISAVMLAIRAGRVLVALSTAYSFGVLLGHLFFPEFTTSFPAPYEVIARMVFVLSPTFYALIIIGAGNGTLEAHRHALESHGQLLLAVYMTGAAIVGGLLGKFALPQHLIIIA